MRRSAFLGAIGAAVLAPALVMAAHGHHSTKAPMVAPKPTVLVELFTAQGCASCGKANAMVARLADRPGFTPLTWSVDYWDYLGWKDTFAQPEFAERQRAYDKRFEVKDVYTPQVIVDGAAQAAGGDPAAVEALIRQARRTRAVRPALEFRADGAVAVGTGARPRGGAEVWLIRFDPREREVVVKDGDNRGTTVPARNVVRQLVRLGAWSGRPVKFKLPAPSEDSLATLIVVQGADGGRILGTLGDAAAAPKDVS